MSIGWFSKYNNLDSYIHRLSPEIKIVSSLIYIICVILTFPYHILQFFLYFLILLFIIYLSRIPIFYILRRSLIIIPFVFLVAGLMPFFKNGNIVWERNFGFLHLAVTYEGLWILWNVLIKSWLAVLMIIVMSSSTRFSDILMGLKRLKTPNMLVLILSFMYRYVFILIDEVIKMEQARRSRYFGGRQIRQIRVLSNMIGVLFIRSYERSERVYQSMCARGFTGRIKKLC